MRACTSTDIFRETSEENYAHNSISSTLIDETNRALITLMYDYNGRGVIALPEFLSQHRWKTHGSYTDCAFKLGARTNLGMWEYLKEDHERRKVFDMGMRSKIVGELSTGKLSGPFPFGDELSKEPLKKGQVMIVDIGGGGGQALEAIKADHPELGGRFVLQDLEDVIEDAVAAGLPGFIEPVVGSFFETQKIHGMLEDGHFSGKRED